MLLKDKVAVIYGAAGGIGAPLTRAFAAEGARLFLAGRTLPKLEALAQEVAWDGCPVQAAQVDVLDEAAVDAHVDDVVRAAGRIDILFNAISMDDVQGMALTDMRLDDFLQPIVKASRSQFLTARAVGRVMAAQGSGVILTLTAGPPEPFPLIGGFGPACGAVEGLWRGLAAELGPHGVRVIGLRSSGSTDTPDLQATFARHAEALGVTPEAFGATVGEGSVLRRLPSTAEVANVAAMMASDKASAMTATFVSVTCGSRLG